MTETRKTILIADDDRDLLAALEYRCRLLGLEVLTVESAVAALNVVAENRPDVVCMDVELPGGNGLAASEMLLSDERFRAIPLIVVTGKDDHDVERRCHQLPAYYVKKSTETWNRLEPLLRELLELDTESSEETNPNSPRGKGACPNPTPTASPQQSRTDVPQTSEQLLDVVFALMDPEDPGPNVLVDCTAPQVLCVDDSPWVLCIDDDYEFSSALTRRLETRGIGVINAFDGTDGVSKAFAEPANAILLDYNMPNGQGDYVLSRLKASPLTQDIPVIVVSGNRDDSVRRKMLSLGADAFVYKPPNFDELIHELSCHFTLPAAAAPECVLPMHH